MKILALSDIHGASVMLRKILEAESSADVIILAGDLTTRGTPADLQQMLGYASAMKKPVLSILGNMDPPGLEAPLEATGTSLNGHALVIGGVGFSGVSASPFSPLHTPNEVPDGALGTMAEKGWSGLPPVRWSVLVAHTPPFGTMTDQVHSGSHVGSPALRRFVERRQPDLVVCGHIHEARGIDWIGKSQVVNCGPAFEGSYAIIETTTELTVRLVP